MTQKIYALMGFILLISGTLLAEGQSIHRYGIFVGANNGGKERVQLRYAESDAQELAEVLMELGGLPAENMLFLKQPDSETLEAAMGQVASQLAASADENTRRELIFYYSGHSDRRGLLLEEEVYNYKQLKTVLESIPADVRIALLDSCSSGSMTRIKGGKKLEPFLMDDGSRLEGQAIITSSSADESSQESDDLEGSFFTHHLVSGLRGGADVNGDNKVTLNEAYDYTYHNTLKETEDTLFGAQHPEYQFNLSGNGDLVLTDMRRTTATLILDAQLFGVVRIRDSFGKLVLELDKQAGKAIELGLSPGQYSASLQTQEALSKSRFIVGKNGRVLLEENQFEIIERQVTLARGNSTEEKKLEVFPFFVSVSEDVNTGGRFGNDVKVNFAFHLFDGLVTEVEGIALGAFSAKVRDEVFGANISGIYNHIGGPVLGAQMSGIYNYAGSTFVGYQNSGIYNLTVGEFTGLQSAGIYNEVSNNFSGIQNAGVNNIVHGDVQGIQNAGIHNKADNVIGIQNAGFVNVTSNIIGIQNAGFYNKAHNVLGIQTAGFVNRAEKIDGVQIGLINIASEMQGAAFGLLNFIGNGYNHLGLHMDELGMLQARLSFGGPYAYNLFYYGKDFSDEYYSYGLGYGFHIPVKRVFFNIEFSAGFFSTRPYGNAVLRYEDDYERIDNYKLLSSDKNAGILYQARLNTGLNLFKEKRKVGVTGALTYNVLDTLGRGYVPDIIDDQPHLLWSDSRFEHWMGYSVGIQY